MIRVFMAIKIAKRALGRNLMRSILTMLGVIIGVGAVIAMVAIGQGAHASIRAKIASLGANSLVILPGSTTQSGVRLGWGGRATLRRRCKGHPTRMSCHRLCHAIGTYGDAGGLCQSELGYQHPGDRHRIPEHPGVALGLWKLVHATRCRCGRKSGSAGANRRGLALRQHGPGRASDPDEEHAVQGRWFAGSKGQSTQGQDQDDIIFMPYTTAQKKLIGITHIHSILASAVSNDMMGEAAEQITALLRQRHRLLPWQENDFSIRPLPTWQLPRKKAHAS